MDDRQKKYGRKMIGGVFQHDFMIKISVCDTFELVKRVISGSGQMPLNTLADKSQQTPPPKPRNPPATVRESCM
jgi:hypothetical protein